MKKILVGILGGIAAMSLGISAYAEIGVYVNDVKLELENEPVIENDSTLIPMRAIFEAIGARVEWADAARSAVVFEGANAMIVPIGENRLNMNGYDVDLNVAAKIINDRTYVPLRGVCENFGCEVEWDDETRSVYITVPEKSADITLNTVESIIKDDEERVLVKAILTYPVLNEEKYGESAVKFNKRYEEKQEEILNNIKEYYVDVAEEYLIETLKAGDVFTPLYYYGGYEIPYELSGKISLYEQTVIADGLTSQVDYFDTYNYDMIKGEEIAVDDILNLTDEDKEAISMYSYYLYEDTLILCLNSDNMIYYQYGYQPSVGLPYYEETEDFFKYDIVKGEPKEYGEPISIFSGDDEWENEGYIDSDDIVEVKTGEAIKLKLGFPAPELSDIQRFDDIKYEIIGNANARVTYTDANKNTVILMKAEGDFPNTYRLSENAIKETVIGNSFVQIYEDDEACYACFTVSEKDGKLYSYSVELTNKNKIELENICKDIIKRMTK